MAVPSALLSRLLFLIVGFTSAAFAASEPPIVESPSSKARTVDAIQLSPAEQRWIGNHPVITIAGPRAFPPFHYYDKGQLKGISADYISEIARLLNIALQVRPELPWPDVLEKTRQGDIDLILCIARTPEREAYLDYTIAYMAFPLIIVSREDVPFIGGIEDLQGKKLAVVPKILTLEWLARDGVDFISVFVNSPLEGLEAISLGKADATIENLAAATYMIQKNGLANLKIAAPTPYHKYELYMAVQKGQKELLSIINKALDAVSPQQAMNIRSHWLSVKYEYGVSPRHVLLYISLILLVCLGILSVVLFWNRRLKKETLERKAMENALRDSEEKLRDILENTTNMYYAHTPDHHLTYISPQCREYLQCSPQEALRDWTEFLTDNPINEKGVQHTEKAIRTGVRQPPYELELKGKKGRVITVEVRENPVVENGQTVAIVGSLTDITQRKKAEKEGEDLRVKLFQAAKMEAVGTLAGGIAHDFNNILGIILGNADLTLMDLPKDSPARRQINKIQTACLRAKEVVLQLLSFSRQTDLEKYPVDPAKLMEETITLLRASMPPAITIQCRYMAPMVQIKANPAQIQQAVINLCTNAGHAMESDGGTLTICLGMVDAKTAGFPGIEKYQTDRVVRITIEDTGTGIDPAIQDRIFEPYFTTKGVGKGTGMGLAIVHGTVLDHGGVIRVDSKPGKGCKFTLLFPVHQTSLAADE